MQHSLLSIFSLFALGTRGQGTGNLDSVVASLSASNERIASSLEKLAGSLQQCNRIDDDHLGKVIDQVRSSFTLESELEELKVQVRQLQAARELKEVFFGAVSSMPFSCHNCPVTYDSVLSDSHGALDAASGTFTVPRSGHYLLQFHALADSGSEAQVEILVNNAEVLHLYDRDIVGGNKRYAMLGQSLIQKLAEGDQVSVRLHKGALKGGASAKFTSFIGMLVGSEKQAQLI